MLTGHLRQMVWRGWIALALLCSACASALAAPPATVLTLRINGAIGPATVDYVQRGLQRATQLQAQLVVLQMDTPGGLDTAMREVIKTVLASPLPFACHVAPQGARAASAGTYILYACHIAAMAPATNLGAATPVAIGMPTPGAEPQRPADKGSEPKGTGDTLEAKRISDAAAYIRGLAQLRQRNEQWAERAVRESVSLAAQDALNQRVIDLVAADLDDLLRQLDGRSVATHSGRVTLATAAAPVLAFEPDWRGRVLAVLSDPSVALILMMIGIYGLLFEFASPGFVAPGVIGAVCLLLGLFGLQMLPVNYVGLGLILLGVAFLVAEAFVPSFGVLGMGGVAAFALGALMLIDTDVPGFGIPISLIVALTATSALFVLGVVGMAARARRRPTVTGDAQLLGALGETLEHAQGEGWALVQGERWRVLCDAPLQPGQRVRVTAVQGLTLQVTPQDEQGEPR